jgi:ABC-type glycerol-3-phosphate transport system permease component
MTSRVKTLAAWAGIAGALAFALFPVYWIVLTAFRRRADIFSDPPSLLPGTLSLDNLRTVWFGSATNAPVLPSLGTSLLVAGLSTVLATLLGVMAAYAMGRHKTGGRFLSMWILSQRFMPAIALVIPLFLIFRALGLFDTVFGLVLLYTTVNVPLAVWLMLGFVEGLPAELEEAALIDGASYPRTFLRVVLPLLKPGIAVTAIFVFIFSWNEYILAYQLAGDETATVTVYLPRLRSAIAQLYGEIAAASLLSVLPALLFAWVMQRYLVRGITLGGGKEL